VDAPIDLQSQCTQTEQNHQSLRFKCSTSRGGLQIPPLYTDSSFSLFECFRSFLSHGWHYNVLFNDQLPDDHLVLPSCLVYLLASSLFDTNQRALKEKIHHISFHDLRKPDIKTTNALHDCRQDLVLLRLAVVEAKAYIPDDVEEWSVANDSYGQGNKPGLIGTLDRIISDIDNSSAFLMESFSLLISTISTLDAQNSVEQARRATLLTQLAFIYVPLSFVTGVFGMNIQQINNSGLQIWVPIVALLISIVVTILIFYGLELRSDYLEGKLTEHKRSKALITVLKNEKARISNVFKRRKPSSDVEKTIG
jgi:hypothetical protein